MKLQIFFWMKLFGLVALISLSLQFTATAKEQIPSHVLLKNAWEALEQNSLDQAIYFTNKCVELYSPQAKRYQGLLSDFPQGEKEDIFFYWPLNDVGTALYIKAEAYRKANFEHRAIETYRQVVDHYSFSQCWIPSGGFWRPAEEARAKIAILTGNFDAIVDITSTGLTAKAWDALGRKNMDDVIFYTNKCLDLYEDDAKDLRREFLQVSTDGDDEEIKKYQVLHDVATCLYLKAQAYKYLRNPTLAREIVGKILNEFPHAKYQDITGQYKSLSDVIQRPL